MGIATFICNAILLLFTIFSVWCAYKAYDNQKKRALKDKALELSKYYADNIIPSISYLSSIEEKNNLEKLTKLYFPMGCINSFDYDEMLSLIAQSNDSKEYIEKAFCSIDVKSILTAKLLSEPSDSQKIEIMKFYSPDGTDGSIGEVSSAILMQEYSQVRARLLNNLEFFSMNFRYMLADEELVYQSLHQTFLSTVWSQYYFISSMNHCSEDKYYTNTIFLFNKWAQRLYEMQSQRESKIQEAKIEPHSGTPL